MAVIKKKRSVTQFQISFLEKVFTTLFIIILKKFKEAIDKSVALTVVVRNGRKNKKKRRGNLRVGNGDAES